MDTHTLAGSRWVRCGGQRAPFSRIPRVPSSACPHPIRHTHSSHPSIMSDRAAAAVLPTYTASKLWHSFETILLSHCSNTPHEMCGKDCSKHYTNANILIRVILYLWQCLPTSNRNARDTSNKKMWKKTYHTMEEGRCVNTRTHAQSRRRGPGRRQCEEGPRLGTCLLGTKCAGKGPEDGKRTSQTKCVCVLAKIEQSHSLLSSSPSLCSLHTTLTPPRSGKR